MPELPEVETIRQDLRPLVLDRTIREAWVSPNAPRLLQSPPAGEFIRRISGRRIEDIGRRGKYLLFHLSGGLTWIVHLRMTGGFRHSGEECLQSPHLRATFLLDDGSWLCYRDLRKLGMMWLVEDPNEVVGKLGPEPLEQSFTAEDLRSVLSSRAAAVKAVLLDQRAVAGIGNIYADEALFEAGIRPERPAKSLSTEEVERLHRAIRSVLALAMGNRGSSFRDYLDTAGREGEHQLHMKVFRRTGQACQRCGSVIERSKIGGRSTHYCPKCQG